MSANGTREPPTGKAFVGPPRDTGCGGVHLEGWKAGKSRGESGNRNRTAGFIPLRRHLAKVYPNDSLNACMTTTNDWT
jgi:hypothetical protein